MGLLYNIAKDLAWDGVTLLGNNAPFLQGTIADTQVAFGSGTAIAGSTSFRWLATKLAIGEAEPAITGNPSLSYPPNLTIASSSSSTGGHFRLFMADGANGYSNLIDFFQSGGTLSSPAVSPNGSYLGQFDFYGHDGTNYQYGAAITAISRSGTPLSGGGVRCYLNFGWSDVTKLDHNAGFQGTTIGHNPALYMSSPYSPYPTSDISLESDGSFSFKNDADTAYVPVNVSSLKQYGSTSGALTHAVPATITSYTITWPNAQGGAGAVLTNDGSGGLTWSTSSIPIQLPRLTTAALAALTGLQAGMIAFDTTLGLPVVYNGSVFKAFTLAI
jgi:hypothetical protein